MTASAEATPLLSMLPLAIAGDAQLLTLGKDAAQHSLQGLHSSSAASGSSGINAKQSRAEQHLGVEQRRGWLGRVCGSRRVGRADDTLAVHGMARSTLETSKQGQHKASQLQCSQAEQHLGVEQGRGRVGRVHRWRRVGHVCRRPWWRWRPCVQCTC